MVKFSLILVCFFLCLQKIRAHPILVRIMENVMEVLVALRVTVLVQERMDNFVKAVSIKYHILFVVAEAYVGTFCIIEFSLNSTKLAALTIKAYVVKNKMNFSRNGDRTQDNLCSTQRIY